jgi:hypothetical protein
MTHIDPNSTASQLKDDIDSGRTGDKVGGFDPAAAPLGTDDEAAGVPPSPHVIAEARSFEQATGGDSARANAAEPELQPNARGAPRPIAVPLLIGVGAAALLAVALLVAL